MRESTHTKIINVSIAELNKLSPDFATRVDELIKSAKNVRELFSYDFPATGTRIVNRDIPFDEIIDVAATQCEICEANSECLASALNKRNIENCSVDRQFLRTICEYDAPNPTHDSDDLYRTGYFKRHSQVPCELAFMAREGLIEDFFGAWIRKDGEDLEPHQFDPDYIYGGSIFQYGL